MPDLTAATTRVSELVRNTTDDDLTRSTPCTRYRAGDLVDHIGALTVAFTWAATKTGPPGAGGEPPLGDASRLEPGWRDRIGRDLVALADAWRQPAATTGMTKAGGIDLPGEVAGVVVLNELVLHGWDLARALDHPFTPDEAELQTCLGFVSSFSDDNRGSAFGPPVPVADGAPLLDRVLGASGRDPHWSTAGR